MMKSDCDNAALIEVLKKGKDDDLLFAYLLWSSSEGYTDIVELLLAKGVDVNSKTDNGYTALILASKEGHKDIVELLLAKGADINSKVNNGCTALMKASWKSHKDITMLLIAARANINARNNAGDTALILADSNSRRKISLLLKTCGAGNADPEKKDWTSLMWAAFNNDNICRSLIITGYYVTYSLRNKYDILNNYISWREAVCNIALMGKGLPEEVSSRISEYLKHSDILSLMEAKMLSASGSTRRISIRTFCVIS